GFDINHASNVTAYNNMAVYNGGYCAVPPAGKKPGYNGDGFDLDLVDDSIFSHNWSYANFDKGFSVNNLDLYKDCVEADNNKAYNSNLIIQNNSIFSNGGLGINFQYAKGGAI